MRATTSAIKYWLKPNYEILWRNVAVSTYSQVSRVLQSTSSNLLLTSDIHMPYRGASRYFCSNKPRKNFLNNLIDNIKEEFEKNKNLQENKRQLNERLKSLNSSDALRDARRKFDLVEKETLRNSEVIELKLKELRDHISKMMVEAQKTETGKKLSVSAEEFVKHGRVALESLEKAAEKVGDTEIYRNVSATAQVFKRGIDDLADVRMYSRPGNLKLRSTSHAANESYTRVVEANNEATDVVFHKESKWYMNWKEFSENNVYFNKFLDIKIRYDESENLGVRFFRGVIDRITGIISPVSEIAEVMTEITKVDSGFEKSKWLKFCEREIIPNILEAYIRGDLNVLKDWCHERAFNALSAVIKEYQKIRFSMADSRIIDISKVELVTGKMMEQGPVLIISFQAFMLNVVKNLEGKVVDGDPRHPMRIHHVWVLCRDMEEYNPAVAWKLLEVHMQKGELAI